MSNVIDKADYIKDINIDTGYKNKDKLSYRKIKGFTHIWTYPIVKMDRNYLISRYTKEKDLARLSVTIENNFKVNQDGWRVDIHEFLGARHYIKSQTVYSLDEAIEISDMFFDNKLILDWRV